MILNAWTQSKRLSRGTSIFVLAVLVLFDPIHAFDPLRLRIQDSADLAEHLLEYGIEVRAEATA